MNAFEFTSALQYQVKTLQRIVAEFESGDRYRKIIEKYEKIIREQRNTINRLKRELENSRRETRNVRKCGFDAMDDLEKEYQKKLAALERELREVRKVNADLVRQRDSEKEKRRQKQVELYDAQTRLEEEQEKNRKLTARINQNFENSSVPSSKQGPERKAVHNTRKKTGRRPGGQPGHPGHGRKALPPTAFCEIPAPVEILEDPDYYETGKVIRKQRISVKLTVEVTEYHTKEYRNRKTGSRYHAPFPEDCRNEVNYDGTVKALIYLLANECNVSHDKIRKLLSELTEGKLQVSKGMINGLSGEFSQKSREERLEEVKRLVSYPVMNADFTNAYVNGKNKQILILASPALHAALFIARDHKGHKGVEGTPLETYTGILVTDHETTFRSYGTAHQECMQHIDRHLTGCQQNEPEYTWTKRMDELFHKMIEYRKSLGEGEQPEPEKTAEYEKEYDEILKFAGEEYLDRPVGEYNREAYKLYNRLCRDKKCIFLFLHDIRVPWNNSLCERLARVYKRKQHQVTTMRSMENTGYLCDGLSVIYMLRADGGSLFEKMAEIFNRSMISIKKSLANVTV